VRTITKVLIGIFAFISFLDLYLSQKGLSLGYNESHILSGLQYGLPLAIVLKLLEIAVIIAYAAWIEDNLDHKIEIPFSSFACGLFCLSAFTGASGTWSLL
jgi:hypothetical protein